MREWSSGLEVLSSWVSGTTLAKWDVILTTIAITGTTMVS